MLLPGALAVAAARPATGATLAFLQLLRRSANAAFSGLRLFCILDPADELIAGQRRDVHPRGERCSVRDERVPQIFGKLVHDTAGNPLAAHGATVERNAPFAKRAAVGFPPLGRHRYGCNMRRYRLRQIGSCAKAPGNKVPRVGE